MGLESIIPIWRKEVVKLLLCRRGHSYALSLPLPFIGPFSIFSTTQTEQRHTAMQLSSNEDAARRTMLYTCRINNKPRRPTTGSPCRRPGVRRSPDASCDMTARGRKRRIKGYGQGFKQERRRVGSLRREHAETERIHVVAPTFALQSHLMHGLVVLILVETQSAVLFPRPVTWLLLTITFTCTDMGCIQSIACNKSRIKRENIVVYDLSATIDHCPTVIEENSPIVLRYKTPYFKASARIVMPPIPRNETWVVGWIQACTQMEFYNTYGDVGMSSWELPQLREGLVRAISDSDGVSYPWYGNTTETVTIVGPTSKPSRFIVSMNDNFYPSVTWAVPVSESNTPLLTNIKRDQSFTTWLVALNTTSREKILLHTIKWRMRVDIAVDPSLPLGSRARLVGRVHQDQPRVLTRMEPIPPNAMGRPNANDAQVLMWRPRRGPPLVVIPPK
ncbi:protein FAM78B-like protein [Lates japonicus]|nr:protein FAM78B-like protein [Lates japonicus]